MIIRIIFILYSLSLVSGQQYLANIPSGCSTPSTRPRCVFDKPSTYFMACGIYRGQECGGFCHNLVAQYLVPKYPNTKCFNLLPSYWMSSRLYQSCRYRCLYAQREILKYRLKGSPRKQFESKRPKTKFSTFKTQKKGSWKASNIQALISLQSINNFSSLRSNVLVFTRNALEVCYRAKDGTVKCFKPSQKIHNNCICHNCRYRGAYCPRCCRHFGYIWV